MGTQNRSKSVGSKKKLSNKGKMQIICKKHNEPIVVLCPQKRQFKCDKCLEEEGKELDPEHRIKMRDLKEHMNLILNELNRLKETDKNLSKLKLQLEELIDLSGDDRVPGIEVQILFGQATRKLKGSLN